MQPERDSRVRCSAWLDIIIVAMLCECHRQRNQLQLPLRAARLRYRHSDGRGMPIPNAWPLREQAPKSRRPRTREVIAALRPDGKTPRTPSLGHRRCIGLSQRPRCTTALRD